MQSSTFVNPVGSDEEVLYTRYGNNPNQITIARKYAMLEGADEALFLSSGMGATALAHLAVLRPGDHLVSSAWIYGGTRRLFDEEFGRFGIDIRIQRRSRSSRDGEHTQSPCRHVLERLQRAGMFVTAR